MKIKNCIEFIEYSYRALTNYYSPTINYSFAYKSSNNRSRLFFLIISFERNQISIFIPTITFLRINLLKNSKSLVRRTIIFSSNRIQRSSLYFSSHNKFSISSTNNFSFSLPPFSLERVFD